MTHIASLKSSLALLFFHAKVTGFHHGMASSNPRAKRGEPSHSLPAVASIVEGGVLVVRIGVYHVGSHTASPWSSYKVWNS